MIACVFTLGCKMNEVESASLAQGLKERGYDVIFSPAYADLYLLNTCAVTGEAERKSRQAMARLKKYNPNAKFVVCGCASQNSPQSFEKEGVLVFGTAKKGDLLERLEESGVFLEKEDVFSTMPMPARAGTRAFLRVQDGCNRFCSYCLIPYLRGRSRSRSAEDIAFEARNTSAKEIVLTGIDLSSYRDGETDLCGLIEKLKGLPARFRLGSLEAGVITDGLLEAMKAAGNFTEHFHLSLQSGSNRVLSAMNRHYTREEFLRTCEKIYRIFPDAAITTDIIVGFPTETEEDFTETLDLVERVGFARVHAFPFSSRKGTNAFKLPDLPAAVKKERVSRLIEKAEEVQRQYIRKFLGRELCVLFESDGGYSQNYIRVYADGAHEGELCRVLIEDFYRDGVRGTIIKQRGVSMENCIFCKIIAGEIPSAKLYEDDEMVIFKDIEPKAKVHLLCVPKEHFAYLSQMDEKRAALVGGMLEKIGKLKDELGLAEGYRVIINQGENAGQTVHHLHIHLLGGEILSW